MDGRQEGVCECRVISGERPGPRGGVCQCVLRRLEVAEVQETPSSRDQVYAPRGGSQGFTLVWDIIQWMRTFSIQQQGL